MCDSHYPIHLSIRTQVVSILKNYSANNKTTEKKQYNNNTK
ncbi:MAG: hypothetical protein ACJAZP_003980 [Psychromonas sp.]|jgi:hypothetical protein